MTQVKIFKSLESNVAELESQVNAWLKSSGARVVSVVGNIAPQSDRATSAVEVGGGSRGTPSDVLVIVTYEV